MAIKNRKQNTEIITSLNGMMTFGNLENGLNALDFASFEAVEMEPFTADCKVQAMRDGNVYITEKPKRIRNTPIYREDNSSLTLGQDGRYYFCFSLPQEQVAELPDRLVQQALAIAQRVDKEILGGKEARK